MDEPYTSTTCVVCSDTPIGLHFGVFTCRACSAFFRRAIIENKTFSCLANDNCVINKYQKCLCKKCRLQKCFDVGMLVAGVKGKRKTKNEEISEPLFLKKLADNYKTLCEERRRTEQALFPEECKNCQNIGPVPGYFLCTVDTIRMSNKVHFPAVVEYLSNSFEEFSELTNNQKWLMIKPFYIYLQWIDACYFSSLYIPPEMYSKYSITSATSYWDSDRSLQTWFDVEKAPDFIKEKLTTYMPEFAKKECSPDKVQPISEMNRLKITEMEVGGLVALMFWNSNIFEGCNELLPIISRVRTRILTDFSYYYKSIGVEYPEIRQGEIFNILTLILVSARRFRDNLQMYNVFGVLDKEDFFYKLVHELQ